jgi:creatinine amidohydrolase
MSSIHMNRMSWTQYRDRIAADNPPVFLPVGALEQHGPHLPLGTDALLSTAIAAGAAGQVGGIVAPALSYGYKSQPKCGGGQHFCGTTSVDAATLIGQVRDTVREFVRHGVRRLVIVNGHYENQWFIIEGIDLGLRDVGAAAGTAVGAAAGTAAGGANHLRVMRLEYWDFCTEETLEDIFPQGFPGFALEHAAVIETSMMLHFHPELVDLDSIPNDPPADFPPYDIYPPRTEWVPASGVLSSARGSTAEKGARISSEVITRIAVAVRAEFGL